jgi:hypothetical protein
VKKELYNRYNLQKHTFCDDLIQPGPHVNVSRTSQIAPPAGENECGVGHFLFILQETCVKKFLCAGMISYIPLEKILNQRQGKGGPHPKIRKTLSLWYWGVVVIEVRTGTKNHIQSQTIGST